MEKVAIPVLGGVRASLRGLARGVYQQRTGLARADHTMWTVGVVLICLLLPAGGSAQQVAHRWREVIFPSADTTAHGNSVWLDEASVRVSRSGQDTLVTALVAVRYPSSTPNPSGLRVNQMRYIFVVDCAQNRLLMRAGQDYADDVPAGPLDTTLAALGWIPLSSEAGEGWKPVADWMCVTNPP